LAKAGPGNAGWQRGLSVSYARVVIVLMAQGNLPEAREALYDRAPDAAAFVRAGQTADRWSDTRIS
jgi:hypothetical protein